MKINLDPVNHFQQEFGALETFERARDFMLEYACQIRMPLPDLAAKTFEIAKRSRKGKASLEERNEVSRKTWQHISEHNAWGDYSTPEYCIMRAMLFLIQDRLGPGESERVSEVVNWFLFYVNKFEDLSKAAPVLIGQYFGHQHRDI